MFCPQHGGFLYARPAGFSDCPRGLVQAPFWNILESHALFLASKGAEGPGHGHVAGVQPGALPSHPQIWLSPSTGAWRGSCPSRKPCRGSCVTPHLAVRHHAGTMPSQAAAVATSPRDSQGGGFPPAFALSHSSGLLFLNPPALHSQQYCTLSAPGFPSHSLQTL